MKTRRLIDGAALGPETLKAVGEAFDRAWAQIAGNFGDNPTQVENARLRLEEAMLSIATEDSKDVAALKDGARAFGRLPYIQIEILPHCIDAPEFVPEYRFHHSQQPNQLRPRIRHLNKRRK